MHHAQVSRHRAVTGGMDTSFAMAAWPQLAGERLAALARITVQVQLDVGGVVARGNGWNERVCVVDQSRNRHG